MLILGCDVEQCTFHSSAVTCILQLFSTVTVIHQVGLDKIRIVNCMFLPSAKFDVKNAYNLVGR